MNRLKSRGHIAPLCVKLHAHLEGLTSLLTRGVRVFTPQSGGSYAVSTIRSPAPAPANTVTGGAPVAQVRSAPAQLRAVAATRAETATAPAAIRPDDLANAEVIVTSASNPGYVGMTNTDAQGGFTLSGVPSGGVSVLVRRDGVLIARGAGVFSAGELTQAQLLDIVLVPAEVAPKQGTAGAP